jgi:hypothetical protein
MNISEQELDLLKIIRDLIQKEKDNGFKCEMSGIVVNSENFTKSFKIKSPDGLSEFKVSVEQVKDFVPWNTLQ